MDTSRALEASPPSSPSSSSTTSSSSSSPYDVFLSFSSEDTRKTFTDHLYWTMKDSRIDFFMEENESTRRGENISDKVKQIIEGSRVSVIVFSSRYADSIWCLEELVQIMECRRTLKQIVLPIFYDLSPSDAVGTFAQAFQKHRKRFHKDTDEEEKIQRWTDALTEAADLTTWVFKTTNGYEGMFIRKIIDEITRRLKSPIPIGTGFSELQEIDSPVLKPEDGHSSMPDWGAVLPTEPFTSRTFSDSGEDHGSKIRRLIPSLFNVSQCISSWSKQRFGTPDLHYQLSPPRRYDAAMDVGMFNNFNTGGQRGKSSLALTSDGAKNQDKSNDDDEKKKVMHREIERKRRQEMANLYGSLRSVLPLEFIKGKRSLADHMNEAVNHIKQLQTRIKIFGTRRDELKMGSASSNLSASTLGHGSSGSSSTAASTLVAVHPCLAGVEVVVSSGRSPEQGFRLSIMLKILLGQGLDVISCSTTQVNRRLVYTIQSEVSDPICINFSGLQQILTEACHDVAKPREGEEWLPPLPSQEIKPRSDGPPLCSRQKTCKS